MATSRNKLFKACEKPKKRGKQACCNLLEAQQAYARLAYKRPSTSLFQAFNKLSSNHPQACD